MPRVAHSEVRQKILDAAEHRLWHYGFKKTTIDEIAADAGVGKGTVYLYFDSKEDIALAIVARFKALGLEELRRIADAPQRDALDKLKRMLSYPVTLAYQRCLQSPSAQELVFALRPHIQARVRPYHEQEVALIAEVLEEADRDGLFSVADPFQTAKTLKAMCAGFWPPYSLVDSIEAIEVEIGHIVDLVFCGLCHPSQEAKRCIKDTQRGRETVNPTKLER